MKTDRSFGACLRRVRQSSIFNIVLILVGMCVLLSLAVGNKFLSMTNITSVVRQFSFYAIMAIGLLLVIITG